MKDRWQQIDYLFHEALEREPGERAGFLAGACEGDDSLRSEVESLLASHEQADNFIEAPAADLAADLLVGRHVSFAGRTIGSYTLVARLGEGGMGEVFLAEDARLARKIAIKVLPAQFTTDEDRLRRFHREARAVSALNHPNIITIHEIGHADNEHFIVTEFIEGLTLRQKMTENTMTLAEALGVAIQVATALGAAHKAGIVHRDIKPENIMLRPDGVVKVLDFGLAKPTERQPAADESEVSTLVKVHTQTGVIVGTLTYMSPEQARGLGVDARSDIFSLGIVIYEMIAGLVPFGGATIGDVLVSLLEKDPAPVAGIPAELDRIVNKALAKDRGERYQAVKDLLRDLEGLKKQLELTDELEGAWPAARAEASDLLQAGKRSEQRATQNGQPAQAHTASSAKYLIGEIRRHKRAASLVLTAVLIAAAAIAYVTAGGEDAIDSVAILPFVNMSADSSAEYLSEGISDGIINGLSHLPRLRVMSLSSVLRYKGGQDAQSIGREMNVRAVLMGRLMQHGDSLTISTELVDVRDNRHLWGEKYDRKMTDVLGIQTEVARQIADTLRLRLSGEEKEQLARRGTQNNEAYEAYLKGRYYWNKRTAEWLKKAIESFERALAKDSDYAAAYAGLSDCYNGLVTVAYLPPKLAYPKAKEAATRALEIDETLAEAHTSLAYIHWAFDWDWTAAEREFKRSIEINPHYATAHHYYATFLAAMGREAEAIKEIKRAKELDPISLAISSGVGWVFFLNRQYDEAITACRSALEMDPDFYLAHYNLGWAYEQNEMYRDAESEGRKAEALGNKLLITVLTGMNQAFAGNRAEAQRMIRELNKLSEQRYVPAIYAAMMYAALGQNDDAFDGLERAYDERSNWMAYLKVDARLDKLRADPRFQALLQRTGF